LFAFIVKIITTGLRIVTLRNPKYLAPKPALSTIEEEIEGFTWGFLLCLAVAALSDAT